MDLSRVSRTSAITLNECKNLIMKSPEAVVKAHPNLSKFVASWKFPMGDWKALAECACTHKRERFLKPILSTLFEEYILDLGSKMSYLCKLMEFATRRDDDGIPGPILTVFIRLLEDWSRMVGVRDGSENTRPALHSIGPQKGTNVKSLNHKLLEDSDADEYMQHKPEAERKLNPAVPGAMKVPSSSYTPNEYDCLGCKERDKKIKELLENKQSLCSSHGSSHPESYMKAPEPLPMQELDEESQQRKMEDILKSIRELSYDGSHTCDRCRKIDTEILQPISALILEARNPKPSESQGQCSRRPPCKYCEIKDTLLRALLDNTDCLKPDIALQCYIKCRLEDWECLKYQYERLWEENDDMKKELSRYRNPSSTSDDQSLPISDSGVESGSGGPSQPTWKSTFLTDYV